MNQEYPHYGGHFEPDDLKLKIELLEKKTLEVDFWNDKNKSSEVINELNDKKTNYETCLSLNNKISSAVSLLDEDIDEDFLNMLENDIASIEENLSEFEIKLLLSDEFDQNGAVLEIQSGAGGVEACDWANMLFRMYERYANKHNYKFEIVDIQKGNEAGIKSATVLVKGLYGYGYLKCERGVHRLVRISPFDSGARRHTSFASVLVTPLFEQSKIDIIINEGDLKIDVYRASGAGGQHVNTTDSAVRITHLPTKLVVTCQQERSQIQNKERCLELLKMKLYQLELDERNEKLKDMRGVTMDVNFGSQIRSYVMHPYSLVKDHRTNTENTNVEKVLDGDIDIFINDNLKRRSRK